MATTYKAGCIATATVKNGKLVITKLNNIYTGSKRLTIYDTHMTSTYTVSGQNTPPESLYTVSGATIGMIAGYFDENGVKHTVELTKDSTGFYWYIPEAALSYDGNLWLSLYGIVDDQRQMSNVVKLSIDPSNTYNVENAPDDNSDWHDVLSTIVDTKIAGIKKLTVTGNGSTYTYNGASAVSIDLDAIIKAVINAYDGDSGSY